MLTDNVEVYKEIVYMEIQRLNQKINWQQMTAKEILKKQNEGEQVPSEFQKWAAAVSASMNAQDDVTYEMVNGETDIAALEEAMGRTDVEQPQITATEETENNIGNETENPEEEVPLVAQEEAADVPPEVTTEDPVAQEEDVTLADEAITTDFSEIIKRRQRKGTPPLS